MPPISVFSMNVGACADDNLLTRHSFWLSELYSKLMRGVDDIASGKGGADILLSSFITPEHVQRLTEILRPVDASVSIEEVVLDVGQWLTVETLEMYLNNKMIGRKRFASGADEATAKVGDKYRPTLGLPVPRTFTTLEDFAESWFSFFDATILARVKPLARVPEHSSSEVRNSVPLQMFALMVHDFVMVQLGLMILGPEDLTRMHAEMLDERSRGPDRESSLKNFMRNALESTFVVLQGATRDAVDVAANVLERTHTLHPSGPWLASAASGTVILWDKKVVSKVEDVTEEVFDTGDLDRAERGSSLCVIVATLCDGTSHVIGGFHADDKGVTAVPAVVSMRKVSTRKSLPLIVAIGANTDRPGIAFPEGMVTVQRFLKEVHDIAMKAAGDNNPTTRPGTSLTARTLFCTERHRAVRYNAIKTIPEWYNGPKDYILHDQPYEVAEYSRTNDLYTIYCPGLPLPYQGFPFEHCVLSALLNYPPVLEW